MNFRTFWLMITMLLAFAACQPLASTPTSPAAAPTERAESSVEVHDLDPVNCRNELPEERRFPLQYWPRTNFCQHSIPYEEIRSGGVPKDRIASIDRPVFQTTVEAAVWLADVEPVIAVQLADDVRAYPLQVLVWHEIVNDVVAGQPVVVTYCPLCNSALVFERTLDGEILDFGTSGNLRRADLIMYDRQTESWWQQLTGEAIVGSLTGKRLKLLPAGIVSFADFRASFPEGKVLFPDTEQEIFYGETPYINYDSLVNEGTKFLDGRPDGRLPPKMRVLALMVDDLAIAYPYSLLSDVNVINDTREGRPFAVFWKGGTTSALYKQVIAESKDVGSAAAFSRLLDGRELRFVSEGGAFLDQETGSTWNIFGLATSGPLAGRKLTPLQASEFLWFAWAAFQPGSLIYELP